MIKVALLVTLLAHHAFTAIRFKVSGLFFFFSISHLSPLVTQLLLFALFLIITGFTALCHYRYLKEGKRHLRSRSVAF